MVQTSHVIARFVSWFLCAFVLHVHVRSPLGIYCLLWAFRHLRLPVGGRGWNGAMRVGFIPVSSCLIVRAWALYVRCVCRVMCACSCVYMCVGKVNSPLICRTLENTSLSLSLPLTPTLTHFSLSLSLSPPSLPCTPYIHTHIQHCQVKHFVSHSSRKMVSSLLWRAYTMAE